MAFRGNFDEKRYAPRVKKREAIEKVDDGHDGYDSPICSKSIFGSAKKKIGVENTVLTVMTVMYAAYVYCT